MARYLWLTIWPAKLSVDYSYNQIPLARGAAEDWLAYAVVLSAAILAVLLYRWNRVCFFLACFGFINFVPASNLFFPIGTIMADRLLYLPSLGLLACLVLAIYAGAQGPKMAIVPPLILCLITSGFEVRTWIRNQDWQSDLTIASINWVYLSSYHMLSSSLRKNWMNRRAVLSALSLASFAPAGATTADARNKFVGVWKLVSGESRDQNTGQVHYPWGTQPVGRLMYDDAGRVFAQLMDPGRRPVGGMANRGGAAAIATASADDMREMLTGFNAYFGTFEVGEPARTVIHHLESALIPSLVGSDQRRKYEFSGGNQLIMLNTASQASYRLVWQRERS
jgi:hypothetical protein